MQGKHWNLLFWQQLAIRLALWFHEVLSVSYAHIWKAVVVEGFAFLLPSATPLLSTAAVHQLPDKKTGRGHNLALWELTGSG